MTKVNTFPRSERVKMGPEASTLLKGYFLRFRHSNPAVLASNNADVSMDDSIESYYTFDTEAEEEFDEYTRPEMSLMLSAKKS
ncbi:MAG: hypothetical protein UC928_04095 [Collinsella sp.]|nr:hypothetical protein [Collinsella sp.]